MAIKGKGKTKSRGVAKAPRRAPVPVPVAWYQRRWVQVTVAVVVGFLMFWLLTWVIDGVQDNRADEERANQRTILETWQAQIETEIGAVGQFRDPAPPVVAPQVLATAKQLAQGKPAEVTADELDDLAASLEEAAAGVEGYPLADAIRDQGFGASADQILSARTEFVLALRAYRQAALLLSTAQDVEDPDVSKALGERAVELAQGADALLAEAYRKYAVVLGAAGVRTVDDPGLGGGGLLPPG